MPTPRPTLLYDGNCALCSGAVQALLRIDDRAVFQFAPLQSGFADELLAGSGIDPAKLESLVVVDASGTYTKSDAFFRTMRLIGWPYRAINVFRVLPKGVRDGLYDFVARNRYRVFGKHESCWMPQAAWRGRFVGE